MITIIKPKRIIIGMLVLMTVVFLIWLVWPKKSEYYFEAMPREERADLSLSPLEAVSWPNLDLKVNLNFGQEIK